MRQRVQFIEQTAVTIAMNPNLWARDLMIQNAADMGVEEAALRKEVDKFVKSRAKGEEKDKQAVTAMDEARKFLESQHKNAQMLVCLALADAEVLEWLRNQDLEELHHDLPGMDMLHRIWLAHFPAGDEGALSVFLTSLLPVEEAAFTNLLAKRRIAEGGLPKAKGTLAALHTERLDSLMERNRRLMKQPDLSPERLQELHNQVMEWRKEYLDRRKPAPDSP